MIIPVSFSADTDKLANVEVRTYTGNVPGKLCWKSTGPIHQGTTDHRCLTDSVIGDSLVITDLDDDYLALCKFQGFGKKFRECASRCRMDTVPTNPSAIVVFGFPPSQGCFFWIRVDPILIRSLNR